MPAKNTIKQDVHDSYYHVFARGVAKQAIYIDNDDFIYFRRLFDHYLSRDQQFNANGRPYPNFHDSLDLLAFCQMNNHFHLVIYQHEPGSMTGLMRGVMTAYSKYFNQKYKRTGPVFESRFKAVRIDSDSHLLHITRYVHLNPRYYQRYPHSSYKAYVSGQYPDWLRPQAILEMFPSVEKYIEFCSDYVQRRDVLNSIKNELAGY